MKPRKGLSFFLKTTSEANLETLVAFCIVLNSKSDEDGEYKIVRTPFAFSKKEALDLPLSEIAFLHFDEEGEDDFIIEEWDSEAVRLLTKKSLRPSVPSSKARQEPLNKEPENLDLRTELSSISEIEI